MDSDMNRYQIDIQVDELDEDGDLIRTCYRVTAQGWSPMEVVTVGLDQLTAGQESWTILAEKGHNIAGAE
jgi:hypothetical protein